METNLSTEFTSRSLTLDDAQAVADLVNGYAQAAFGVSKTDADEIRSVFTTPGFDVGASGRAVLAPDGRIVGVVLVLDVGSPPIHPRVIGAVDQAFEHRGIGTYLLQWAVERSRQAITRVPEGVQVSIRSNLSSTHEASRRLYEKAGFRSIRYSWIMSIDLDRPQPEPAWSEGIVVCTYQEHPDFRAVVLATDDAFRDHYGYYEHPEEELLEQWKHRVETNKEFDPTLWFLAMDGKEIAGVSLCLPSFSGDPEMGWVDDLGVRRPWRRRGLGEALLLHSFGEFYRRGKKRAGLGVDAGSLTGATRLYEKVGMHATMRADTYELILRPGKELGRENL